MAGATPVFLKTTDKEQFKITKESLAKVITPRSKVLFMNSPGNPTGMVYTEKELKEIVGFAVEKGLHVISDEIYEKNPIRRRSAFQPCYGLGRVL